MKNLLFILTIILLATLSIQAQFPEDFEGATFPPAGWSSYIGTNGLGTVENWEITTTDANSGSQSAFVEYESVSGGLAQDWLVTPQFTPTADLDGLSIFHRQDFEFVEYGTIYTIRVSTASQTNHADFTIIETMTESDLLETFAEKVIDLSAYNSQPIYVAFVMEQDNGDSWYIDDVSQVQAPPCNNNSSWGTLTAPTDGSTQTTICTQAGDYVQVNGIQQGLQYKFSSTIATDFITVRNASNNALLKAGVGPQFVTALSTDDMEIHINLDDGTCGTNVACRDISIECSTCVAVNNCNAAQALNCGDELTGESTATSTDDGSPGNCTIGTGNWYKYTPTVTSAVNLIVTPEASYNVKMAITTTPNCIDFSLFSAGCQDQQGAGGKEFRDFVAVAGTTYHIYVGCPGASCTDVGTYDLQLLCSQSNYGCSVATVMNCGDDLIGETTAGAIRETFNPGGCTAGEGLWYKFTPPMNGAATVTATPASDFDVQLSVLTSTDCSTFTAVTNGCVNTFQDGFVEILTFNYSSGTDYYFYVGNAIINDDFGTFDLSITCDDGFCNNNTMFPNNPASAPSLKNTIVTIATNQWAGDYALITDVVIGETYNFTNSASDLITIRDAVTKEVFIEGVAPVFHSATNDNDLEIHYNLDDGACGTENTSRTTTIECLSCGCPSSYTQANGNRLIGQETGTVTYETDGDIESEQLIIGGSSVTYDAAGDIYLLTGFEVFSNANFTTTNNGCSTTPFQSSGNAKSKIIIKEVISEESLRRRALQN